MTPSPQAQASHGPDAPTSPSSVGMTLVPGAAASLRGHGGPMVPSMSERDRRLTRGTFFLTCCRPAEPKS